MSCETMQEDFVRRLAGDLPETEARELERHLGDCENCRVETATLERLWNGLDETPAEKPSPRVRERFDAMLAAEIENARPARPLPFPTRPGSASSSGSFRQWLPLAATLAIGFSLGWLFFGRGKNEVVTLQDLQKEVGELHQLVAESMLQKSSVSDRLQGVAYGREYSAGDDRVAATLLDAIAKDPNVNVRLAALEALRPVAARDEHREVLITVAARPDSPLVSLSIIDLLLEAGTPGARRDLEQLLNDPHLEPVVRGYLRDRLGRSV